MKMDVGSVLNEASWLRRADEVNVVAAAGQLLSDLFCDDSAASKGGIAGDPDAQPIRQSSISRSAGLKGSIESVTERMNVASPLRAANAGKEKTRSWGSPSGCSQPPMRDSLAVRM